MIIETTSIMELSIAIVGVIGALGGLLKVSNCSRIKCGLTGMECDRVPPPIEDIVTEDADIEIPKLKPDKKKKMDDFSQALESRV